jgi:hypothetical protein
MHPAESNKQRINNMQRRIRVLVAGLAATAALFGSGKQNPNPPNTAEVRVSNATIPAGGTVQAQFSLTEPHPITSTGAGYALDDMSVDGVAVWSPIGDACGVGVVNNGKLYVSGVSPSGSLGNSIDYPFLTITTDIPATAATGTSFPLTLNSDTFLSTATGPLTLVIKPGTLVIGGSVSIRGLYPGGGTWPAGTLVRVMGTGFKTNTHLTTKFKTNTITFVSANEFDLTLKETTTLDSQIVTVVNPDGSTATYYSYLRGVMVRKPARVLLQQSEPAFPQQTHAIASLTVPNLTSSQFVALALQNPNPGPLVVTFQLGAQTSTVVLPSGYRVMDDLATLLNLPTVNPGDTVSVTSTAPLQIMGLLVDESNVTVTPLIPTF